MPPDPSKVAEIAEGLIEAQRRAILDAEPRRDGDPDSLFVQAFAQSLYDAGLISIVRRGAMLNWAGLAVHQYLTTPNTQGESSAD